MRFEIQPCTTYDQLKALYNQMVQLHAALPRQQLTALDRRELGGHLIPNGSGIVDSVGLALQGHPERYPDLPVTGEQLLQQNRGAQVCAALRNGFLKMAEMANDAYLVLQSGSIRQALSVVRTVHDQESFQHGGQDLTSDRNAALVGAYILVDAYYQGLKKKKAKKREEKRKLAGVAPVPEKPTTTAQKRRARQDHKDRMARFHGEFSKFLDQQPPQLGPKVTPPTPASPALVAPAPPPSPVVEAEAPVPAVPSPARGRGQGEGPTAPQTLTPPPPSARIREPAGGPTRLEGVGSAPTPARGRGGKGEGPMAPQTLTPPSPASASGRGGRGPNEVVLPLRTAFVALARAALRRLMR